MEVRFQGIKSQDPTQDQGLRVTYAAAKRTGFSLRWRLMLLIVISPVLLWLWLVFQGTVLVRADGIVTTEPVQLRASQPSFVNEVVVNPGDRVAAGQTIIDLSSPEIDTRIQIWNENLEELVAFRGTVISNLDSILEDYGKKLAVSRERQNVISDRYEQLEQKQLFTLRDQMDLNELQRDFAQDEKDQLVDLERLKSVQFTDELAEAIREAELEIAVAEVQQAQLNIRADREGTVNRIYAQPGEFVTEGQPLAEISNYETPVVNVYLPTKNLAQAYIGKEVSIVLPGRKVVAGIVRDPVQVTETIPASLAGPFEGSQVAIKVVVQFVEPPETWIEGLPVRVRFLWPF